MRVKIQEARKNRSLTMREIAEQAGISPSYYAMIEHGTRNPSGRVAVILSDLLAQDIRVFFEK